MSNKTTTRTSSKGETDLNLIVRVTTDIEMRLAEVFGASAASSLFELIEQASDSLSSVALTHAHKLRLIRNDMTHRGVGSIAQSPNSARHRTHKAVRQGHALVMAEIRAIKHCARLTPVQPSKQQDTAAPVTRMPTWLQTTAIVLVVAGGLFASQLFGR